MKDKIKVSIIVPAYNAEKYIDRCLKSLLNQTMKEIEIIIINDGSTDKTEKIIKSYKDTRIKYHHQENKGIGHSRNLGVQKSKGEYICFVDSDDYVSNNMIEKLYEKITKEKLDMVVCDYIEYDETTSETKKFKLESFENTSLENNPNILSYINLGPCNKMFRKELIENIKFPEDLKYEDVAFMTECISKANQIGKVNEYLNYFTVHTSSETTTMDKRVFDIFKVLDIAKKNIKNKKAIENLIVFKITTYTIQQRYQKNKKIRNKFIDDAFKYLKLNVPKYKKVDYLKNRNIFKKNIEQNKTFTKLYCNIYNSRKK